MKWRMISLIKIKGLECCSHFYSLQAIQAIIDCIYHMQSFAVRTAAEEVIYPTDQQHYIMLRLHITKLLLQGLGERDKLAEKIIIKL